MKAIVTGATGFLGRALCLRLKEEGADVVGIGRDEQRGAWLTRQGIRFFRVDLSKPGVAAETFPGADVFVHAAALSSAFGARQDFLAANVEGTRAAIAIASAVGARRFVFVSSPSVYATFADQFAVSEGQALPPALTPYADSKRLAEQIVLSETKLSPVVLRPRAIYGRGDVALLPRLIRAAETGALPLLRGGRARTNLTHVDDVVEAILAACADRPDLGGEIFNIAGNEELRVQEIVEEAAGRAGIRVRWRPVPWIVALAAARASEALALLRPGAPEPRVTVHGLSAFAFSQTLDGSKARAWLGFAPKVAFAEGLERTFRQDTGR